LMLPDINGVFRGKWLAGADVQKLINGDVRLPLSTYAPNIFGQEVEAAGLGIVVGDPDGMLVPIKGTLNPIAWSDGQAAQVLVDMVNLDGGTTNLSPRGQLAAVVNRLHTDGFYPVVASELEFYIFQKRDSHDAAPMPPAGSPVAQNYDLEIMDAQAKILIEIEKVSKILNLPTDTMIAEYGPGQFEINFHHTRDILAAADTAMMFRRVVRSVVSKYGYEATFIAKPYLDYPGNGMHLHTSVLDADGVNIFDAADGVHPRLGHAIAGVLHTMRDMQAIFAPHYNSYRRFQPNSFAPTAPNWGQDDRRVGVRVPQSSGPGARFEHRICGADVNPYLAIAAILAGMHFGLEQKLTPPPPNGQADALTHNWEHAVDLFAGSDFTADVFGQRYRDVYAAVRRDEIAQFNNVISPMEYQTYLGRL